MMAVRGNSSVNRAWEEFADPKPRWPWVGIHRRDKAEADLAGRITEPRDLQPDSVHQPASVVPSTMPMMISCSTHRERGHRGHGDMVRRRGAAAMISVSSIANRELEPAPVCCSRRAPRNTSFTIRRRDAGE